MLKLKSEFNVCTVLHELARDFCAENNSTFDKVLLVGMQHMLDTTVDMLSVMKKFGLKDAVIGGKRYSTHTESAKKIKRLGFTYVEDGYQLGYGRFDGCMQEVVHRIWFHALKKIESKKFDLLIILDDGADLLHATPGIFFNSAAAITLKNKPDMIIGIEQTRGGTNHPLFSGLPFPIINVAGSFIKTTIEYPKVAEIVANKVLMSINAMPKKDIKRLPIIGVLGYGTMGKAIARHFLAQGFSVIAYDKNKTKQDELTQIKHYDHASIMIANADIIIGCTGEDVTAKPSNLSALLYSKHKKWLISTGSKDYEFNSLLRTIQNERKGLGYLPDPLQTIHYKNHVGVMLEIIRGGFPVNFTNEAHSIMPEHIWPTRAALMLACFLAADIRHNHFKKYLRNINTFMLPSNIQALILRKYCEYNSSEKKLSRLCELTEQEIDKFISKNSDGVTLYIENESLAEVV